jgi:spore coat polysaccharide biosynthesis predicted glycosyltransferase SpsG
MGGSDVKNVTPTIMNAFDQFNGCVDVVIGPGFSNVDEIKQTADVVDTEFRLLFSPDDMAEIMQRADFAVTTCGGTVFELLAVRTPFIGIPQVENQQRRATALRNHKLALILDKVEDAPKYINKITSSNCRKKLYKNIGGVIDGRGAKRVYNEICTVVNK